MPTLKRKIRGMQDLHTMAGKIGFSPHEIYMRISCLEMEKMRRGKEKEGADLRIRVINSRFEEIDKEINELLQVLKDKNRTNPSARQIMTISKLKEQSFNKDHSFKIKY